jgi:predicted permease
MLTRRPRWIAALWRDTRYALRSLAASPGFTTIAGLTLAVGIAASTAMFSVLDAVVLRPLPVGDEDRLAVVWHDAPARAAHHLSVSYRDLTQFRRESRTFAGIAGVAWQGAIDVVMDDGGDPIPLPITWVTGDFFPVLDQKPIAGRGLLPADDAIGAAPVMVVSEGFARRRFGDPAAAVGHALGWEGTSFTVVGVIPRGLELPGRAEAWLPVIPSFPATVDSVTGGPLVFDLVGRLRPGATLDGARHEYATYLSNTEATRPAGDRGLAPVVTPLARVIAGDARPMVLIAAAAVALLLLIAAANVANLLLIRGSTRLSELAVRSALGAGRGRIVQQLMVESGVLAIAGGVVGLALAFGAVKLLVTLAPAELPRRDLIQIDPRFFLAGLALTGTVTVLAGLLPALVAAAGDPGTWLRGGRTTAAGARRATTLRSVLVTGQISLAVLVVAAAVLLTRSFLALEAVDLGFNEDRLVIVETFIPSNLVSDHGRLVDLQEAMLRRVAAIPGVVSTGAMPKLPFSGQQGWIAMYTGEGQTVERQERNPWTSLEVIGPGYFATLQIPLVRGRAFGGEDRDHAVPVAIVSAELARTTWPGADPIGRRIAIGSATDHGDWMTVVGVAGETRYNDLRSRRPSLYLPTRQWKGPVPLTLAIRTRSDPAAIVPSVRRALREVHPGFGLASGGSMKTLLAAPLARPRFSAVLLGSFAAVILLLAAIGVYGALAAMVRHRHREIGIRLGLGATGGGVRALVLREGLAIVALGATIGLGGALAASRLLRGLLFGISPTDPLTFVVVVAVVFGAAGLACYWPARRASRVDPLVILRAE